MASSRCCSGAARKPTSSQQPSASLSGLLDLVMMRIRLTRRLLMCLLLMCLLLMCLLLTRMLLMCMPLMRRPHDPPF